MQPWYIYVFVGEFSSILIFRELIIQKIKWYILGEIDVNLNPWLTFLINDLERVQYNLWCSSSSFWNRDIILIQRQYSLFFQKACVLCQLPSTLALSQSWMTALTVSTTYVSFLPSPPACRHQWRWRSITLILITQLSLSITPAS